MAFLVPARLVAFGIILIPLAQALWISFRRYTLTVPGRPFIWLANYGTALSDAVFWIAIGRTLYFTLTSTGLKLVLGMLIADEFFYALILTSSLKAKTIPVAIAEFSGQHMVDYGMIAAGGVLAALPPVLIALVLQRHIVRELAAGAVKGSFGQRGFTAPIPVWYGTLIIDYREGCHFEETTGRDIGYRRHRCTSSGRVCVQERSTHFHPCGRSCFDSDPQRRRILRVDRPRPETGVGEEGFRAGQCPHTL